MKTSTFAQRWEKFSQNPEVVAASYETSPPTSELAPSTEGNYDRMYDFYSEYHETLYKSCPPTRAYEYGHYVAFIKFYASTMTGVPNRQAPKKISQSNNRPARSPGKPRVQSVETAWNHLVGGLERHRITVIED